MNENISSERELVRLPVAKMQDVLLARFIGREEAAKIGFPVLVLTRISTAISEIARNVVQHAGQPGEAIFTLVITDEKNGIRIVIEDLGKGVEEPEKHLNNNSAKGMGAGLPSARKLMDEFHIHSVVGQGTKVTMVKWL